MTDDTDAGLLARLQSDPAALEVFYRRHRDRVLAFAVRRCRQPDDVTDLVASTFLAVLEKPGSFDPRRGDAGAWLVGIAARQWLLVCRAERKQQVLRDRSRSWDLSSDDIARLEDQIDAARASEPVWAALDQIEPRYREALRLVGPDGLSAREAAAALGISAGAFRVRLMRARRAAKGVLGSGVPAIGPASASAEHIRSLSEPASQEV